MSALGLSSVWPSATASIRSLTLVVHAGGDEDTQVRRVLEGSLAVGPALVGHEVVYPRGRCRAVGERVAGTKPYRPLAESWPESERAALRPFR
jgi:hypothetical protein